MDETFLPKPRKKKAISEKDVEKAGKARVADAGGLSLKFTSPGRRNVPDQIELYGTAPMEERLRYYLPAYSPSRIAEVCCELLAAAIQFTECKRPGKKATTGQAREHERLRALGFRVNVVDQQEIDHG